MRVGVLLLALAGCAAIEPATQIVSTRSTDWKTVVTRADRERLSQWRDDFTEALREARASGHSGEIAAEGAFLEPDSAIAGPAIPNGKYRCRTIKLGSKSPGMLEYVAYPWFSCLVRQEGQLQQFAKLGGSQRQAGTIFPSNGIRQVFLGTLALGDETRAMVYGVDEERDVAGFVEQVGDERWRLLMPSPAFESKMDVMEIVPAE